VTARIRPRVAALALLAAAALVLTACASPSREAVPSDDLPSDPSQVVTVHVVDNAFEPAEVEIEPGQAVRWVFEGRQKHDVLAQDGSFASELMNSGDYVHVFDESGEWSYTCSVHAEMVGTVTVG